MTNPRVIGLLGPLAAVLWAISITVLQQPDGIVLYSDEAGYTAPASVASGRVDDANLAGLPFYSPVYSLLLVPLLALLPISAWTAAVAVNVLLVGLLASLSQTLAIAMGFSQRESAWIGLLSCVPAVVLQVPRAWPEVLLAVVLVGWVLSMTSAERGRASIVVTAFLSGLGFAIHGRMIGLILGWAVFVALRLRAKQSSAREAAAGAGIIGLLVLSSSAVDAVVLDRLYDGRVGRDPQSEMLERLVSPSSWLDVVVSALGQVWTLSAATLGIGAIGLLALSTAAVRPSGALQFRQQQSIALLTAFVSSAVVSGLFLAGSAARADHPVYGRYLAVFGPVLAVIGLRRLRGAKMTSVRGVVIALVLSNLLVVAPLLAFGRDVFSGNTQKLVIVGILPFQAAFDERGYPFVRTLNLLGISAISLVVTAAVVFVLVTRWSLGLKLLSAVWFVMASVAAHVSLKPFLDVWEPAGDSAVELVGADRSVGRTRDLSPTAVAAFEADAGYPISEVVDGDTCPDLQFILAPRPEAVTFDVEVAGDFSPLGGVVLRVVC